MTKKYIYTYHRELINEWDFIKNVELNFFIMTSGSHKRAWWLCKKCHSSYDSTIANRTKGYKCPYCAGRKINNTNSLQALFPSISKEWHPTKNINLLPTEISSKNGKKVWWLGTCEHEWKDNIYNRTVSDYGCPYCKGNHKVLKGYNDMWTTNPDLANLLHDINDGYLYRENSDKKVDWKCSSCNTIIKNKMISNIKKRGLSCPSCADGISYPAKVMFNLLQQLNIKVEPEKRFEWCSNRFYDFYLPDLNWIIEVHGEQHYRKSNFNLSLSSIEENDNYKENIAIENNINRYIIIDARASEISFIRKNIERSILSKFIGSRNIDWSLIDQQSRRSNVTIAKQLYKEGYDKKTIASKLGVHHKTVNRYLN